MIHLLADVKSKNIGENTTIWQFSIILEAAKIGRNCNINCHTFIENDVIIGDNVTIKSGVYLWDGLRVEDNVFIGPNVTFINDIAPRSKHFPKEFQKTLIKKNSSIGANSTILGGLTIGEFAMIGAGTIVTKDIPPFTVWYGNPVFQKGYITKDGKILDMNLVDKNGIQHCWIEKEII
jgi:UDP-2-acetamido-3-amino-2,3-dideoxy-glucuronate N-acetyltransferase